MRKRSANPLSSPKKGNHQSTSNNGFVCSLPFALGIQLFILCIIALLLYGGHFGGSPSLELRDLHNSSNVSSSPQSDHEANLQIRFLQKADSWIAQVYHDEPSPPINGTSKKLKAVDLRSFCRGNLGKSHPRYAIFRDVVLAERKLYLPSMINCTMLPKDMYLATKFNQGQKSTPSIEVMVVSSADTFEDFEPHLSCHERVYEPSVIFSLINWPQYGHAMFNGISLLSEIFNGPLVNASKNVRLYAYGDSLAAHERQKAQEFSPFFDMQTLEPLMSMFSHQPVRSVANLLMQSDRHPVCFSYLLVGLSGELDHYNFHAPLEKWRDFANAVKSHFKVGNPPRVNSGILQRLAPQDALRESDPDTELGEIKQISWKDLPGRPRLTILDRKSNRVIINVGELEKIAVESGYFKSVEVIYLEEMKMAEQIQLMGKTDVLFGMDGTGMMNGIFLPEGGVVVHLRPYGCKRFLPGKGVNFDRLWAANPGRVIRQESGERSSTRFPTNIPQVPEVVFDEKANVSVWYKFSFILKQDTVVDPLAFRCILDTSHKLLHGIAVDWPVHLACTRSVF